MVWTYPDLTDTLGLDFHFAAEVNSAVAGMVALALSCSSFSKLMGVPGVNYPELSASTILSGAAGR